MHEFRVWAPRAQRAKIQVDSREPAPMQGPEKFGWWTLPVESAGPSSQYAFFIEETAFPDPRSESQPRGVHASSRLYDHSTFSWTDANWHTPP